MSGALRAGTVVGDDPHGAPLAHLGDAAMPQVKSFGLDVFAPAT
jgi:hypothetical protein